MLWSRGLLLGGGRKASAAPPVALKLPASLGSSHSACFGSRATLLLAEEVEQNTENAVTKCVKSPEGGTLLLQGDLGTPYPTTGGGREGLLEGICKMRTERQERVRWTKGLGRESGDSMGDVGVTRGSMPL